MTIKIKLTNRPVVKTTNPELYVNNTFHMKKAIKYTYNYASLDDYIVENWATKTIAQLASDMNEYAYRVVYRRNVLVDKGLIEAKYKQTGRTKLVKEYRVLMTQAKAIQKQLKETA
jgi:hypothetical protein|tara:strand:- start:184 stop:531 length:348 start_codon:yes stop_codon:yes gene_type:complete